MLDRTAAGVSRTRRAESSPSEQQNSLVEHPRSEPRRLQRTTLSLADGEQGVNGTRVGEHPLGWCGLTRGTEETPETHQPSSLRRRLSCHELGSVSERLRKIQVTRRDAGQPLAHGVRTDSVTARRDGHLRSVAHGGDSREDVSNVVDLAGQNVGRQQPFTSAAVLAARQPNRKARVAGAVLAQNLHAALDRARRERQILTATPGANAAAQDRSAFARQATCVASRLHIQYVDQAHVRLRGGSAGRVNRPLPVSAAGIYARALTNRTN